MLNQFNNLLYNYVTFATIYNVTLYYNNKIMSLEYTLEGHSFGFRYQETRGHHEHFCAMTDEEFLRNLPSAAHLACFISWIKELPHDMCLGDRGVVHELIHLLATPDPILDLKEIREKFNTYLKLA